MPRSVQIALPPEQTDYFIGKITTFKGLLGLRVQRGISLKPPGDVISVEITSNETDELLHMLDKEGVLDNPAITISTAKPLSILSNTASEKITTDGSETIWEETLSTINEQSQMTVNNIISMTLAGMIATLGIMTNTIDIVIGASLLAPGFGAISRISLGVVTNHYTWKHGVKDTAIGYTALISGALLASFLMDLLGKNVIVGSSSYLSQGVLLNHFTTTTLESLLISVLASVIGALLILSNRTILTAGVMIALALVPSATITGMGLSSGEFSLAAQAFGRLLMEIGLVALFTGLVFILKRKIVFNRRMKI